VCLVVLLAVLFPPAPDKVVPVAPVWPQSLTAQVSMGASVSVAWNNQVLQGQTNERAVIKGFEAVVSEDYEDH
jgi:hypothetical protein